MDFVAAAPACEPSLRGTGTNRIDGEKFVLVWRAQPATLPLSEFFVLEVGACARKEMGSDPISLRVDAQMPVHKHGINYRPSVLHKGGGRFIVEGLLLHMPGRWELIFDLRRDQIRETLRAQILL